MLVIPGDGDGVLVFLPGFMSAASSYSTVLSPVAAAGITVLVPQLYTRGVGALSGRVTVASEAAAAADLVRSTVRERGSRGIHLGGHSRGGQAAWLAAGLLAGDLPPTSLVLVDPVDGAGRHPRAATSTASAAAFDVPTLILGAGVGGRCAPAGLNHEQFAAATPHARHVVVSDLGHADMLDDRPRALGRRLCPGGPDPDAARALCAELVLSAVLAPPGADPLPEGVELRRA